MLEYLASCPLHTMRCNSTPQSTPQASNGAYIVCGVACVVATFLTMSPKHTPSFVALFLCAQSLYYCCYGPG